MPTATPFTCTEDAWFWTIGALRARREGGSGGTNKAIRPCEPDDVVRCLDRLYRAQRIDLAHARVLRVWGERQFPPYRDGAAQREAQLWREALSRLDPMLRAKGIVA